MPDIPAEAVRAAAKASSLHFEFCDEPRWQDCAECVRVVERTERGLKAAAPFMAGVGSPSSCPSAAPESTQSPAGASVAPVYRSGVERPAESLSAPRGEDAHPLANSHASEHADDELARALRIADYHAGLHRQAADAIARVHQVCHTALATPDAPDRWAVAAQVRAALEGPEPHAGAGAVSEEQTEPVRHLGGNAEDCPACDITTMPYPFLCPGEEQTGGQP